MPDVTHPPEFRFAVQPDRERVTVRLAGELDLGVAGGVAAAVDELIDAGFDHVVMDLRELSFMDSAGVHMLVSAQQSAERRKCAVSLIRGPGNVQRVLELTAADSLFTFLSAGTDH
jgi:anti-sigma B factor antagonist